jgi:hypothetical protein
MSAEHDWANVIRCVNASGHPVVHRANDRHPGREDRFLPAAPAGFLFSAWATFAFL